MKKIFIGAILMGSALCLPVSSFASFEDGWDARISAAYNPVAIDLNSTVKGQQANFASNSSDFMSLNNSGFHVRAEAWKGKLGFTADTLASYFDVQSRVDPTATVSLVGYALSTELGASYMVASLPLSSESRMDFEAMGGGRFVILKQTLEFDPGNDVSDKKKYVEPYVGGRATWLMNKRWSIDVRGNIGGFGIGNASEMTWVLAPELNFKVSKNALINLGYKVSDIQTEDETGPERNQLDGRMYGPFIGAELRFAAGE